MPLAVTDHLHARRVDHQMDWHIMRFRSPRDLQPTAPPRKGGVVRCIQQKTHQWNQRRENPLGPPKREPEHRPKRQRRDYPDIRVLELPTWTTARRRIPGFDCFLVKPHRDVAPPAKRSLMRSPVRHPVFRLVFRRNPALRPRRHGLPPECFLRPIMLTPSSRAIGAMHQRRRSVFNATNPTWWQTKIRQAPPGGRRRYGSSAASARGCTLRFPHPS